MKKLLSIVGCAILAMSIFVGCGNDEPAPVEENDEVIIEQTTEETSEAYQEQITEEESSTQEDEFLSFEEATSEATTQA